MDLFHNLYLSAAQTAERETRVGSHELFALMVKAPNFSKQIRSYIPPAKPGSLKHTVGTPQVLKSCLQETLDFTRSAKWCLFLPCIWKNYIRLSLGETTTTTTLYKGCYLTYLSSQPPPRWFLDVVCFSCRSVPLERPLPRYHHWWPSNASVVANDLSCGRLIIGRSPKKLGWKMPSENGL